MSLFEQITNCSAVLTEKLQGRTPKIGLVLGSGLGPFADTFAQKIEIPYSAVPGLPSSTVHGHKGQFVSGTLNGTHCLATQGRLHGYEGFTAQETVMPIRTMIASGITTLIITNAAGGLNPEWPPGTLMLITDHIRLQSGHPLNGPNEERLGPRFPDMTEAYSLELRNIALASAEQMGTTLQQGVYVANDGPAYETPAEVRFAKVIGGDAVGMSTASEVIAARHMGARVLGISCITNYGAGLSSELLDHSEVTEVANRVKKTFQGLLTEIIRSISN